VLSSLLCARGSFGTTKLLTHIGSGNVELVWSMWGSYWQRERCADVPLHNP
jgi:hypothetical protein